jgi:general secretion pathway protein G
MGARKSRGSLLFKALLVVLILVFLAGILIPTLTRPNNHPTIEKTLADIANLQASLEAFRLDTGRLPTADEGLEALSRAPTGLADRWKGPYLNRMPVDKWGHPYLYMILTNDDSAKYRVFSCGPDGVPSTNDDIWTEGLVR